MIIFWVDIGVPLFWVATNRAIPIEDEAAKARKVAAEVFPGLGNEGKLKV